MKTRGQLLAVVKSTFDLLKQSPVFAALAKVYPPRWASGG